VVIERALDRLLNGRSSVIIAHRLATVRRADRIFVVEHGRIVQAGSAAELLAEDGPFRRLASTLQAPLPPTGRRPKRPGRRDAPVS
jgi:ATP-binding cassette, subfamily B, bacterial